VKTPFSELLVANRGEIAQRIFATAELMGLRTVAVYVDADAEAPFVSAADEAVNISSYLDGDSIIAAAALAGAGAVHPGYGFLAENADFASAVQAAGLVWVGPSSECISAMGDKLVAKQLAIDADVPVLASSDDPAEFATIGFPLLIKAAAGGGGKGMRVVEGPDALADAIVSARREAASGFGDDRVFAERFVGSSRHIEIQVLGDAHGNLIHLGERECSIQRRHQKIIEESPSPLLDPAIRQAMSDAALRLASRLSYRSAGTVEFLLDDRTGEFFFLEVNTRLQVEHAVTEAVTGVDLVAEQIRVAQGERLTLTQESTTIDGHSIEARLYAEDPSNNFLPDTGTLDAFLPPTSPPLRWDNGVAPGSVIGVDFDPMIAKVTSTADSRAEAAAKLALGLERLHIGGLVTNRDFLVEVLRSGPFIDGDTTTDFIERHNPQRVRSISESDRHLYVVAAAMWLQANNRNLAHTLRDMPSGWRLGRLPAERVEFAHADADFTVHYRTRRDGTFILGIAADEGIVQIHAWSPNHIDLDLDGHRRSFRVTKADDHIHLTAAGGSVTLRLLPRFAPPEVDVPGGAVAAPMPGKVIEIRVSPGDTVRAGDVVAVLEAMKMENHLRSAEDGTIVDIAVAVGDQVEKDTLLMVIEPADDEQASSGAKGAQPT
jgi:propionyl-CoA carboxylase alpha chain